MLFENFLTYFSRKKKNGSGDFHAPCPAHDDDTRNPEKWSLHITAGTDGILLHCFAGCENTKVLQAIGLKTSDLFYSHTNGTRVSSPDERGPRPVTSLAPESVHAAEPEPAPTIAAFAVLKRLPLELLQAEGWVDAPGEMNIPYRQRDGSLWRVRRRQSLKAGAGFKWDGQKELGLIPYGRHRLDEALDRGKLLLVEGESDALTAWHHRLPCLGFPGADTPKAALMVEDLVGIDELWIVMEPGGGGAKFIVSIATRLRTLDWKGTPRVMTFAVKDLSELHLAKADPKAFMAAVMKAKTCAVDLWALEQKLIAEAEDEEDVVPASALGAKLLADIKSGVKPDCIATPFPNLNDLLDGGFMRGELGYIAARESVGKTALTLQLGAYAAQLGHPTLIVSLEMSKEQVWKRIVSQQIRVAGKALRRNELDDEDKRLIEEQMPTLMQLPIYTTNLAGKSEEMEERIERRVAGPVPFEFLIVDHLQNVDAPDHAGDRRQQIEAISKALRTIALRYNVAVVCICELTKTEDDNRPPEKKHLKESGKLVYDADTVILLHRTQNGTDEDRQTKCHIAKQRNGRQGNVDLIFNWIYTSFEEA